MKNKLFNNTIIFSIGEVVPRLLSFILLPIYMHYFNPEDYGIISYINALITILPVVAILGLATYVLRFYFEKRSGR